MLVLVPVMTNGVECGSSIDEEEESWTVERDKLPNMHALKGTLTDNKAVTIQIALINFAGS